jgi:MFS family permease
MNVNYTETRLLFVFILNQSLHWLIIGILIPILTLLQLSKGLDLFQVGLVIAIMSGAVIVLELPTGGLADAIGRKRLYLISMVTTVLAYLVVLFSWNFPSLAAGFLLMGVARALSSGSMDAWFVDEFHKVVPGKDLQPALAKVGVFVPLGLGIGSLIGGILPMTLGQWTLTWLPVFDVYSANLLVAILFAFTQMMLTSTLVHEDRAESKTKLIDGFKQVPEVLSTAVLYGLRHRIVLVLLLTMLLLGFGLAAIETFWQPQLKNILGSAEQTWIFGLLSAGYFAAGSLDQNYPLVLFLVRLLLGISLWFLAAQQQLIGFSSIYLILLMFVGIANPLDGALFNQHIPSEKRSTLLSFQSLFLQLGGLLGSVILGYLTKIFDIPLSWMVAATLLGFSAFLYLFIPNKKASNTIV